MDFEESIFSASYNMSFMKAESITLKPFAERVAKVCPSWEQIVRRHIKDFGLVILDLRIYDLKDRTWSKEIESICSQRLESSPRSDIDVFFRGWSREDDIPSEPEGPGLPFNKWVIEFLYPMTHRIRSIHGFDLDPHNVQQAFTPWLTQYEWPRLQALYLQMNHEESETYICETQSDSNSDNFPALSHVHLEGGWWSHGKPPFKGVSHLQIIQHKWSEIPENFAVHFGYSASSIQVLHLYWKGLECGVLRTPLIELPSLLRLEVCSTFWQTVHWIDSIVSPKIRELVIYSIRLQRADTYTRPTRLRIFEGLQKLVLYMPASLYVLLHRMISLEELSLLTDLSLDILPNNSSDLTLCDFDSYRQELDQFDLANWHPIKLPSLENVRLQCQHSYRWTDDETCCLAALQLYDVSTATRTVCLTDLANIAYISGISFPSATKLYIDSSRGFEYLPFVHAPASRHLTLPVFPLRDENGAEMKLETLQGLPIRDIEVLEVVALMDLSFFIDNSNILLKRLIYPFTSLKTLIICNKAYSIYVLQGREMQPIGNLKPQNHDNEEDIFTLHTAPEFKWCGKQVITGWSLKHL